MFFFKVLNFFHVLTNYNINNQQGKKLFYIGDGFFLNVLSLPTEPNIEPASSKVALFMLLKYVPFPLLL